MIESEKHKLKLFETYEFSVIITNLPKITKEYSIDNLECDLQNHILKVNLEQDQ